MINENYKSLQEENYNHLKGKVVKAEFFGQNVEIENPNCGELVCVFCYCNSREESAKDSIKESPERALG